MDGKSAKKKSNEIAEARMVSLPSKSPLKKNLKISYSERLSKPGSLIRRNTFIQKATKFLRSVINLPPYFIRYLFFGSSNVLKLKLSYCFQAHVEAFDMVGQGSD